MVGLTKFFIMLNENYVYILICLGLIISIVKKTVDFFSMSEEKRIEFAKKQIKEVILRMISDAETDYDSWKGAGAIKRSQVIEEIYAKYPILEKVADQDALIKFIDNEIDNALVTLRQVIENNK